MLFSQLRNAAVQSLEKNVKGFITDHLDHEIVYQSRYGILKAEHFFKKLPISQFNVDIRVDKIQFFAVPNKRTFYPKDELKAIVEDLN